MPNEKTYDNFPLWIPALSWTLTLSIDILGAYILFKLSVLLPVFYLLFCMWVEYKVLKYSCVNCYYCGKTCGLGKGKLANLIFKKGDPQKFIERKVSWKDMVPDFLVLGFPLAGGTIYLIKDFTLLMLVLLVILTILSFGGIALVRGKLVCKYCRQRELGCPAQQLFGKNKNEIC
jgi:hypothetical protein